MTQEPMFVDPRVNLKADARVLFVSDSFAEDAGNDDDLTFAALMETAPVSVERLQSSQVNLATLTAGAGLHWVFGNITHLNAELIPSIVANLSYSVVEFDYKFCKYRSPTRHHYLEGKRCDCDQQMIGKLISAFYYGASSLWWMSERQQQDYLDRFPFLSEKDNVVLSHVFSPNNLGALSFLKDNNKSERNARWVVLDPEKLGERCAATKWCAENSHEYQVIEQDTHQNILNAFLASSGVAYTPSIPEICPRLITEAKLLGCDLHTNNVQHVHEEWFKSSPDDLLDYLYTSSGVFWNITRMIMNYKPTISGYTTTYNCISQEYPFEKSIQSMLNFCDEVCVVDGGSTDETWDRLCAWASKEPKLLVKQVKRDWNHPRHAVFDGLQKAEARKMCKSDFCWQMDSDEIVPKRDAEKVTELTKKFPKDVDILSLPVIDLWGSKGKVRVDATPWKWRLSRNKPSITHGIPAELRRTDSNGDTYAAPGTDGCDMIDAESGQRLNHITFVSRESEGARMAALQGNTEALKAYQQWMTNVTAALPAVVHYSWQDLPRKIKTYKNYWSRHWESLYNVPQEDTAENNMFFDKPWSKVSDDEITDLAGRLENIGGWIWHKKWDGTVTPHINLQLNEDV